MLNSSSPVIRTSLPQATETPVRRVVRQHYTYRTAYARSADSRASHDPGQDYLALREDDAHIAFVICDGVSQSFFGNLAAQILGEALLNWMWQNSSTVKGEQDLKTGIQALLGSLILPATERVYKEPIPDDVPEMVRQVLEQKRAQGSQSTFVCGLVDLLGKRTLLAWMGDSRLRLWDVDGNEASSLLGNTFQTSERWSTLQGLIGEVHTVVLPYTQTYRMAAFTDGLASLDTAPIPRLSDRSIQEHILLAGDAPSNDDISLFNIWLRSAPLDGRTLPAPQARVLGKNNLEWQQIQGATHYEVKRLAPRPDHVKVQSTVYSLPEAWMRDGHAEVQVRAWQDFEPGEWSQLLEVQMPVKPMQPIVSEVYALPPLPDSGASPQLPQGGMSQPQQWGVPQSPIRKHLSALPYLLGIGGLGLILLLGVVFFFLGQQGQGPLAFLATETPTMKPTFTLTQLLTETPTETAVSTFTPGMTASPEIPTASATITETPTSTHTPTQAVTPGESLTAAPSETSTVTLTAAATTIAPTLPGAAITPPPCTEVGQTWPSPVDGRAEMVCVPAGEFLMGSDSSDTLAKDNEKPQHTVFLDAYWIDRVEVTNAMYARCVMAGSCTKRGNVGGVERPVKMVTWNDAKTYCEWAGRKLPSEAQWEKAARWTDGRIYPWGNKTPTCSLAWFKGCGDKIMAVGSLIEGASPYGALDMAGNVWEWTADWYEANYYSISPTDNSIGPATGEDRVVRGGSYLSVSQEISSATRMNKAPNRGDLDIGFRCVFQP